MQIVRHSRNGLIALLNNEAFLPNSEAFPLLFSSILRPRHFVVEVLWRKTRQWIFQGSVFLIPIVHCFFSLEKCSVKICKQDDALKCFLRCVLYMPQFLADNKSFDFIVVVSLFVQVMRMGADGRLLERCWGWFVFDWWLLKVCWNNGLTLCNITMIDSLRRSILFECKLCEWTTLPIALLL